jgi:hypothetical protein
VYKIKIAFLSLLFVTQISYSQNEDKITPIHFIKIDVFKSAFSQLHFDYERYNGKRGGMEIGIGLFYPNPALYGINESSDDSKKGRNPNIYAFKYKGYGIELKRKFYFPKKHWNPYIAPELSFKYKYLDHAEVLISGERFSSDGHWNIVSRTMYRTSLCAVVGFTTKLKTGRILDINTGLGFGDIDVNTVVNDYGRYDTHSQIEGRNNYKVLILQFSLKLCFGLKGKSK